MEVIDIKDLIQDDHNFNRGTQEGGEMIEKSIRELGAGRSVLIDKNNRLIAGNKVQEKAISAGIKKVVIIDSDGDTLVAVRRKDVDLDSEKGRRMALADNVTHIVNLSIDQVELHAVQAQLDSFDPSEFGGVEFQTEARNQPQSRTLRPFVKNHVLISYPIDRHDQVMQAVESLRSLEDVELEMTAN